MNNEIKVMKGASPFDDSAPTRLKHMGLLDAAGGVQKPAVAVLGHNMAGLLFNDLCDHHSVAHAVVAGYEARKVYLVQRDYTHLLVRYSIQYDIMRQPLPPTVWWLSGSKVLVQPFLDSLMKELGVLVRGLESEVGGEEVKTL